METLESLEYYKLKDELGQLLKDEIKRNLDNERDLQQKYIGLGLKIAAAGIAAAVLTLGLFGIKSFYEVNSAIDKIPESINTRVNQEVTTRFDRNNPVAKYEMILLESAARSVAASIATQADHSTSISLEDPVSDIVIRALANENVQRETKLSLVDAMSADSIKGTSPSIDQAVIALAQQAASGDSVDEESLRSCFKYFSARNPEKFAAVAEKIYDARSSSSGISLAIGRYATKLQKDHGEELIKKLEKSDDPSLKYLVHIRNLSVGKVKQVDRDLFQATLTRAFKVESDDDLGLTEVIDDMEAIDGSVDNSADIIAQLLDTIRGYALSNQLTLAVENASPDRISIRFYNAAGRSSSAAIDRTHFDTLIGFVSDGIRDSLRQSKGEFTDAVKQTMEFWFPRSDLGAYSTKAGALGYRDIKKVRFIAADGGDLQINTMSGRAIITTQGTGADAKVVLKWNTEIGETKTALLKTIVDFNSRFLWQQGIWNRVAIDN